MSIESSPPASIPKVLGAVENGMGNSKTKGKLKPDDEAAGLAGGGFLAMMTALEPAAELGTEPGAAEALQPGPVLPALTPGPTDVLTGLPPEPVALSAAGLPNELAMLLAQAGAGLAGVAEPVVADVPVSDAPRGLPMLAPTPVSSPSVSVSPLPAASAAVSPATLAVDPAQTLPAADALAPDALALGPIPLAVPTAARADPAPPARAAARASSQAVDKGQGEPALAAGLAPLRDNPEDAKSAVSTLLEQAAQAAAAPPGKARSGGFQSGLATAVSDARGLPSAGRLDLVAREPALPGLLLGGEAGDTLLKPAQRQANKFSGLAASAGVEGAWGHQALLGGSRVSASAVLASTPAQSLESMVADTVSYWTTQGVQNAELTLDGFGDEAVAVRISLKGDQAHIGFRTDQPEIRQMLEGALAHLKEVLKSEGLVLSGVSVGSSGQNGAGAQEQRDRADSRRSRQASLITPEAGPVPGRQRINPAVGRALDMFV
ncbi:MAG: flagellar hook-length control protein FliK [Rhodoferax sp.]